MCVWVTLLFSPDAYKPVIQAESFGHCVEAGIGNWIELSDYGNNSDLKGNWVKRDKSGENEQNQNGPVIN